MTTGDRFQHAVDIMHRLRAPGGCPWDREQTFDTIKQYTLEETYEVIEAIELRDWDELPAELGDLLLQVLFYSEMAGEERRFSIDDVLDRLCDKLVRRHPHVFGDVEAATSSEVLRNWEAIKRQEKSAAAQDDAGDFQSDNSAIRPSGNFLLDSVSSAMPALLEGLKLSNKAAGVGFDWPNIGGLFEKLEEESGELRREVERIPPPGPQPIGRGLAGARESRIPAELHQRLQDELGDLLFVLVNLARYLDVDPESALRSTNRKFRRRFRHVERRIHEQGRSLDAASPDRPTLEEMERYWQESKGLNIED